jgi:hypothetical protein
MKNNVINDQSYIRVYVIGFEWELTKHQNFIRFLDGSTQEHSKICSDMSKKKMITIRHVVNVDILTKFQKILYKDHLKPPI